MKRIRVFLEYLAAFLIISILLFFISSLVIVKFYGDEVKQHSMDFINEQVDTQISIEEMGVSIFRKFPYTSIYLNDITVWSGHKFNRAEFNSVSTDTLFSADMLYLQFNLIDLVRKRYNIKSLEARKGLLHILIDEKGGGNFDLQSKEGSGESSFLINLKEFVIRELDITYINKAKEIEADIELGHMVVNGNFSRDNYQLYTKGSAHINSFYDQGIKYISNQDAGTDIAFSVSDNHFKIVKGELELGTLVAGIDGEFLLDKEIGADLDLHITGKRIDLEWLTTLLNELKVTKNSISGSGRFNLDARITGVAASTISPHIEATFSTENVSIRSEKLPAKFENIKLSGSYSNGVYNSASTSIIDIPTMEAEFEHSRIEGALTLRNFLDPEFKILCKGKLLASDLQTYFSPLDLEISDGWIVPDLRINGKLSAPGSENSSLDINPEGTIEIDKLNFALKQNLAQFSAISGNINIGPKKWETALGGSFGESDFTVQLSAIQVLNYIRKKAPLIAEGTISSPAVDIDEIAAYFTRETKKDQNVEFQFPDDIRFTLDFNFGQITKGELSTKHVNGSMRYDPPAFYLEPFYLETMDGSINASLALFDLNKAVHQLNLSTEIKNVQIEHLFYSFNNFGQDYLTHKNLHGSLSGSADFLSSINRDFTINTNDIISQSSITISDGVLLDFEPMIAMSKFLKIDKMDEVRFSTIQNTILIRNNMISIPTMDIESSIMKLSASGTQGFDKTYDYHLAIRLSELLFNKARSAGNQEFEVALDEEDQRVVFLMLYDEGKGMEIDFDEDQAMKKIRSDMRDERTELKVILNEEFGIFKNDQAVQEKRQQPAGESRGMRFEFQEDDIATDSLIEDETKKRRWWQRNTDTSKNRLPEFVIDDSDL